ncbi:MAG: UvrD-helicase domain-containing protein [Magnetococcales bacterium]|nr:UvrD-helicase domain-containing protein [Magnetococcales bacterium]
MLADAEVREEVLDPNRSFIVQAPAGSGKTAILTQRFLRLLAGVERPEEVVAITFTRKAAGEMQDRILEALLSGENTTPPQDDYARRNWELARQALARDRQQHWNLLRHPARLRVLTIDGLCAAIAHQMPISSGMGVPSGYTREAEALFRQAAREVLAHLEEEDFSASPMARLLEHLDNNPGRVETLLADLLGRRDQWLRFLPGGHLNRQQLESALATLVQEHLERMAEALPMKVRADLPALLHVAAQALPQGQENSPLAAWRETPAGMPSPAPEDLPRWRGVATLLLTSDGSWRKKVDRRQGFPPESEGKNPTEKKRLKENKSRIMTLLNTLAATPGLDRLLYGVTTLPDPRYNDQQWEILQALGQLLPRAAATLRVIFSERSEVDFTEVAMAAGRALGGEDDPSDLALRLDDRIHHLLVDEFQDTSQSQFRLLKQLTAGWHPGDGRTLFLVGDPMQSIYRFRDAEVGLFLQVQRDGLGSVPLGVRNLTVNFRSDGGLVEWCNRLFQKLMPTQGNLLTGETPFAAAHPFHPASEHVPVTTHIPAPDTPGSEAEQVVALLREMLRNSPEESIAILVRSRQHLGNIVPALRQTGIPFQAVEILQLAETPVVQDLFALTRALLHLADRVHWLAVLRAPWCGLTLPELHLLTTSDHGDDRTIWERLHDPDLVNRLEASDRERLARVMTVLDRAMEVRRRVGFHHGAGNLRRWVEATWYALGGPATCHGPEGMEDAQAFLNLLEGLEKGGDLADFRRLDQGMEQLFAAPVHPEARIQVMTIHKAKGLEFDTVMLPGLQRTSRGATTRLLLWMERPDAPDGQSLLLAPLKRSDQADPDPIYAFLAKIDQEKERWERVRLLYVAATRARRRLHLFGDVEPDKSPPQGSFLHLLWPVVQQAFMAESPERVMAATRMDGSDMVSSSPGRPLENLSASPPAMRRLPATWHMPDPLPGLVGTTVSATVQGEEENLIFSWAGESVRLVGIAVHRWLHRMAREGITAWPVGRVQAMKGRFAAQLTQLGVMPEEIASATQLTIQALTTTLADSRGRWILERHAEAQSEMALTGRCAGRIQRVVLDRTFVDSGTRWIIDFKTGRHAGGDLAAFLDREQQRYRKQMETYATLMGAMDERPLRLGLYFPLAGGEWREVVVSRTHISRD